MTETDRVHRPVRTSFIVGLGFIVFISTFVFAFANFGYYGGYFYPYLLGAISGAIVIAGVLAYLAGKLRLAFILLVAAAVVFFALFLILIGQEGLSGDFYPLWLVIFGLSVIIAFLIRSCR